MRAATVIETPPILICGIRTYTKTPYGLKQLTEAWMNDPPKELRTHSHSARKTSTQTQMLQKIDEHLDSTNFIRVITATQPTQTSLSKKKPDINEIEIGGGTIQQQLDYAKTLLGKTVTCEEVFKDGQHIDVASITTGKGFQGPVKRWHVTILQHKGTKNKTRHRHTRTMEPTPPHVQHPTRRTNGLPPTHRIQQTHPQNRQRRQRSQRQKADTSATATSKTPTSSSKAASQAPEKRTIRLRTPARPPKEIIEQPPQITHISLESPQGK